MPSHEDNPTDEPVNQVSLRGRLAAAPQTRELPSGDVLTTFRLVIPRRDEAAGRVDSIECLAVRAALRRKLERAEPGDTVELSGQLHRRFWRSPTGPASRYAVQADSLSVRRAGRRDGAARARKRASG